MSGDSFQLTHLRCACLSVLLIMFYTTAPSQSVKQIQRQPSNNLFMLGSQDHVMFLPQFQEQGDKLIDQSIRRMLSIQPHCR